MTTISLKKDINRKLIHIANCWIALSYIFVFQTRESFVTFFVIVSIISVIIELSRKRDGFIKNIFARWFDPMLKEHELKGRLTGASWTFVTVAVLGILFPRDIVVLSLLFLHVGDPVAAMVGMKFGTIKIFGKSLEGTLAGMAACILVSLPFSSFSLSTRLLASAWAMLMEVLPWPIDDNVVIPVMGATMLWVIG